MACARIVATLAGGFVVVSSAIGAPINMQLADDPMIASDSVALDYAPESSLLRYIATGTLTLRNGLDEFAITHGTFTAFITVDTAGNALEGSFRVRGGISDGNPLTGSVGTSVTLLEGEIAAFGWQQGSRRLEAMFGVQDGALKDLFGEDAGLIVEDSGFGGSWNYSFGTGAAFATIAPPVPAPGALAFAGGVVVLGARRRRR